MEPTHKKSLSISDILIRSSEFLILLEFKLIAPGMRFYVLPAVAS